MIATAPATPILAECRDIILDIAPELRPDPLYVTDEAALAVAGGLILGWACNETESYPRQILEASGEWQGPGRFISLALNKLETPSAVRCVALHEAAHLLPARPVTTTDKPPSPAAVRWNRGDIRLSLAASNYGPADEPWTDDDCHGWKFIRRALHLHHRATVAGYDVDLHGLCAGVQYGCVWPHYYAEELGDEPARLASLTFDEIESFKPPDGFMALWNQDVAKHFYFQHLALNRKESRHEYIAE